MMSTDPFVKTAEMLSCTVNTSVYVTNEQRVDLLIDPIKETCSSNYHNIYPAISVLNDSTKSSLTALSAKPVLTVNVESISAKVPRYIQR